MLHCIGCNIPFVHTQRMAHDFTQIQPIAQYFAEKTRKSFVMSKKSRTFAPDFRSDYRSGVVDYVKSVLGRGHKYK